jgi:DNA-directed RNA polymerase specialized sigma subunit
LSFIGRHVDHIKAEERTDEIVLPYFTGSEARSLRKIFDFLNDKDRDILYLIFVSRKKQKDVQRILNRSQPSLCYDIQRIRRRLKFIFYLNSVLDIYLNFVSTQQEQFTLEELDILTMMFYSSSFTMTANMLGISQVKVRYTFNKCLKRMEVLGLWEEYEIFVIIRDNLNIIRRVYNG